MKPQIRISDELDNVKRNASQKFSIKISQRLSENKDDPLAKLEDLWKTVLEWSQEYDLELQGKISEEINKGRVQIKAQNYITNQNIIKKTKFSTKETDKSKKGNLYLGLGMCLI